MFFLLLTIIKIHAVNSQIFLWYWRVAMNESFDMIEASIYPIYGALRDLVPLLQFKKCKKHLWKSVTSSKVAG